MSTKTILDVSRYQGMIDWDAVVKIGLVDGVMLKTVSTNRSLSSRADGLYIDPTFERNYAECKRELGKRVVEGEISPEQYKEITGEDYYNG